jgi:hypothetical protein
MTNLFFFVGCFALPFKDRFPVFDLFAVKLFLPFFHRKRALGPKVTLFVAVGASVAFDVVKELTLGIVGDLPPFNRGGRVGAFETRGEGTGFFMCRAEIASPPVGSAYAGTTVTPTKNSTKPSPPHPTAPMNSLSYPATRFIGLLTVFSCITRLHLPRVLRTNSSRSTPHLGSSNLPGWCSGK